MLAWGCLVLIPINKTDNELISYQAANPIFAYSAVDTISIANVHDKSKRYVPGMLVECGSVPYVMVFRLSFHWRQLKK